MATDALRLYAGPLALAHIRRQGLSPQDVVAVAGAAGGPKGLVLNHLDRHIFGDWLPRGSGTVHLVGASIGAWRMAAGAMDAPAAAFERLAHDYIHQDYEIEPGRRMPSPNQVSGSFARELDAFFDGHLPAVLAHRRYVLHVVTSRGRHVLAREGRWRTPLGYFGAALSNGVSRKALGAWLERVVFSSSGLAPPVDLSDLRHRTVQLTEQNFKPALLASCSIPFVLNAVHDIPGAPLGAYWDGGITDYHLHWNYASMARLGGAAGIVLYPHFQRHIVPGWLDKAWKHRHRATPFLDNVLVLAPDPDWVRSLPNGKLPDREDFKRYGTDLASRVRAWSTAVAESRRLDDEWQAWLRKPDADRVHAL